MHEHRHGVHAHVARDVDGRNVIELLKRDDWSANMREFIHRPQHNTNSENIKLNIPAGFAEKDTNDSGVATAVNIVYVTMSPTFSGSVLGYVTASADSSSSTDAALAPASVTSATTSSAQFVAASSSTQASSPAAILSSTTAAALSSVGTPLAATLAAASSSATSATSGISATALSGASSQQDVSAGDQNTGMTDGAKAGLAIGIILAVALAAGLFFFCWKRQKKDNSHDELNEKSGMSERRSSFFGAGATPAGKHTSVDSDKSFGTIHHTATAPRLSLRPVTQFLPTFGEKRKSGNLLGAAPQQMSEKNSTWERRPQGENPFADSSAQRSEEASARDIHSSASQRSWEGSEPATSNAAQVGTAAAVAVGGQGAPAQRGPNNVHRVQLDFKPSMDDELELKSGQLVRMLHEYDDGWVSLRQPMFVHDTNNHRLSVSAWTEVNRVSLLAHVSQRLQSSHEVLHQVAASHHKTLCAVLHPQARVL